MSAFWSQPTRSDEEERHATQLQGVEAHIDGQRHDRIVPRSVNNAPTAPGDMGAGDDEVEISAGQKMLSAVSGSILTSLLVTPLDVVRVRLQSQPQKPSTFAALRNLSATSPQSFANLPPNLGVTACCREVFWVGNNAQFCVADPHLSASSLAAAASPLPADCAVEEHHRRTFTSTFDGLRKIARNEGITTLWRGLSPTLVMAVPANVIYFTGYDWLRFSKHSVISTYFSDAYAPLVAGSVARVAAATVISPIEMFRTRMQAAHHHTGSAGSLFKETLKELGVMVHNQGYSSLWRGLSLTLWRDVPFSGFYWWGYESIRSLLNESRERRSRSRSRSTSADGGSDRARSESRRRRLAEEKSGATFVDSFLAGAGSGAVAAVVTTPFDVGKTRQQVFRHDHPSPSSASLSAAAELAPEQRSMPRFLWHIVREEGVRGLFKGWAARCLKVAPACAIMISSYEIGKKAAANVNQRREEKREGGGGSAP